jgi:hypothetical protein
VAPRLEGARRKPEAVATASLYTARRSALLAGEGPGRFTLRWHEGRCRTGGLLRLLGLLGFAIAALLTFGHSGSP